jgi:hypothetical protein
VTEQIPTRVVMYASTSGSMERIAEFQWFPHHGVTLQVFEPKWGALAQDYYQNGVPFDAEMRRVPRTESETFMRALVQHKKMSYCSFIDES